MSRLSGAAGPGWSAEFAPNAQACSVGSMTACDNLYREGSVGDVQDRYGNERYGSTCGGRLTRGRAGG